jgi:hypothetical protein
MNVPSIRALFGIRLYSVYVFAKECRWVYVYFVVEMLDMNDCRVVTLD